MNTQAEKIKQFFLRQGGPFSLVLLFSLEEALREERRRLLERFAASAFRDYVPGQIVSGYEMEDEDEVAAEFNLLYRRARRP